MIRFVFLSAIFLFVFVKASTAQELYVKSAMPLAPYSNLHFNSDSAEKKPIKFQQFIIPAVMITYGAIATGNNKLTEFNRHLKEEIWDESPHSKTTVDNYLQWVPAVAVYGLNAVGIKGEHNLLDR